MRNDVGRVLVSVALAACTHPSAPSLSPPPAPRASPKVKLAVLPTESSAFPKAAQAATDSLTNVRVGGIDETRLSMVSLEVVQLSIECVEPTPECYTAVGRSLAANRLLFAQIASDSKRKQLKVTVMLFDVDANQPKTVEKLFATEQEATAGVAELVGEAIR